MPTRADKTARGHHRAKASATRLERLAEKKTRREGKLTIREALALGRVRIVTPAGILGIPTGPCVGCATFTDEERDRVLAGDLVDKATCVECKERRQELMILFQAWIKHVYVRSP